jgi:diguanylate cyclase (GGDEF)-like protein
VALAILATDDIGVQTALQAQLRETIDSEVAVDLVSLGGHLDVGEHKERAELEAINSAWTQFLGTTTTEQLVNVDGAQQTRLSSQVNAIMTPIAAMGRDIAAQEADQGRIAYGLAAHRRTRALTLMVFTLVLALCAGVGVVLWLIRSVLPRTLAYSRFAARVADGHDEPMDEPVGNDEISNLGHVLQAMAGRGRERRDYEKAQFEFTETMQLTVSEEEAHGLLKRHLERSIPSSEVTVLARNSSADRLVAVTSVAANACLSAGLEGAKPRSCLAVRQARTHHHVAGQTPLVSCDVCGACPSMSTCIPLLVRGEVIGSVLTCHEHALGPDETNRIHESVVQAAPVVANLRNLAVAELRAATDALTGLPNKRAVADNLKRMVAQANRAATTMAMLMLDLDHFKEINDALGHSRGDEVLAAVGVTLAATVRECDFAGRFGGEEFVVLLPDVDLHGARRVGEKIQSAVAGIFVPGLDRKITASIGIALVPDHGGDPETLERAADRALYSAKQKGRNRIELAGETDTIDELIEPALIALDAIAPRP